MLLQSQLPSALLPDKPSSKRTRDVNEKNGKGSTMGVWSLPASAETLQLENRSRSGMRTSLLALVNLLDPNGSVTSTFMGPTKATTSLVGDSATTLSALTQDPSGGEQLYNIGLSCIMSSPLREFIELRGFSPVADRIEVRECAIKLIHLHVYV